MTQVESEKKAKRNAARRLGYWADRRLKDIIRRRAQVEGWVETYDSVLEEKQTKTEKASLNRQARVEREARSEVRAA